MRPERLAILARRMGAVLAARPRHRRLVLVLGLAPGVVVSLLIAPSRRDPAMMLLGLVLVAAAVVGARALEAWVAARTAPSNNTQAFADHQPPERV